MHLRLPSQAQPHGGDEQEADATQYNDAIGLITEQREQRTRCSGCSCSAGSHLHC